MPIVGIDQLKRRLSEFIRLVEGGGKVVVTRHNRPVVQLISAEVFPLLRGKQFGTGKLQPALRKGTRGAYLEILEEDRHGKAE